MPNISSRQFGLIVAFLIPGFIGLAGLAPLVPLVKEWLQPVNFGFGPTIYALMAATALGMILSCFRWLLVDHMLEWFGVRAPAIDFRQLGNHLEAFDYLADNHYRYYQFYANTFVAILWAYPIDRLLRTSPLFGAATDVGFVILCLVLFLGSRDALTKYRLRTNQLIGKAVEKGNKS